MEKVYYSDSELQEFKKVIITKLSSAEEQYKTLKDDLSKVNSNGTDDTGWTFNMLEDGANTLSKEEINILAQKQLKFIDALKNALIRIENKSYGICRQTGDKIPKERLLAVPHTTVSINQK